MSNVMSSSKYLDSFDVVMNGIEIAAKLDTIVEKFENDKDMIKDKDSEKF